jgi:2-polyprenyl-6-methoxyphenol hydroxylase-like FAD-dependent oxidoreductase
MNRPPTDEPIRTSCCIAGGGPAGMMLGFLLARAGVEVLVLEKHADFLRDRVGELIDWSEVKLLTVKVDRLRQWYRPGLLCIGDAAHAMSPIGGVGINLAIQDAVAAANILALPLRQGSTTPEQLRAVQRRRELPTRVTQGIQVFMQNRVIRNVLASSQQISLPLALRLLRRWRWLQRIPAYLVGLGVRPEHVRVPGP